MRCISNGVHTKPFIYMPFATTGMSDVILNGANQKGKDAVRHHFHVELRIINLTGVENRVAVTRNSRGRRKGHLLAKGLKMSVKDASIPEAYDTARQLE